MKKRLVILASGGGSNADNICTYFKSSNRAEVVLIACNKAGAGAFEVAQKHGVESFLIDKESFHNGDFLQLINDYRPDLIILAGFLWRVPAYLVSAFPDKILNIHPALLPKYGGKGMYGHFVHEAVVANGEKESGITVHWVNEHYDEGAILFQATATIDENDGPKEVEQKVRALEIAHFPQVIDSLL